MLHPNRVIYSLQDNDNNDRFDGNLIYLPNNYHDFPKSGGKLINIKGINNNRVLVLQEDQATVFNSYNTLEADVKPITTGSGALFQQNLQQYIKTDIGWGGSQTQAIALTEFGVFWADNKRGQILQLGEGINDVIPSEDAQWFKEFLPFKILNYFPDFNIDNAFKDFGMNIWYDAKYKRVFFNKRDFEPQEEFKNKMTFHDNNFYIDELIVFPDNPKYFCDRSFTIAYSPTLKQFISLYTFNPNYSISLPNYFQTGLNNIQGSQVYNHLLTKQDFCRYYGEIQPFIVEYSISSGGQNRTFDSIEYLTEYRRYINNTLSYSIHNDVTYTNALVYNTNQSSGNLELVVKDKNNMFQWTKYPKIINGTTQILVENTENFWKFNGIFDKSARNGHPLMKYECGNAYKTINNSALTFVPTYIPNYLRSDYFSIRFEDLGHNAFQIIHKISLTEQTKSI